MRALDFSHGLALWFLLGNFTYAGTVQHAKLTKQHPGAGVVIALMAFAVAVLSFTYVVGASAPIPVFW